jgi:cytochrome c oxidase subunit 4
MSKHIVPVQIYMRVFIALMALLVLTVLVAIFDLGPVSTPIALLIAAVKGTLIVLFFMHVKYAGKLTWIFASSAFLWLAIMIGLTFSDYVTRRTAPNTIKDLPHVGPTIAERSGDVQAPKLAR